jgi:hypothetical protein
MQCAQLQVLSILFYDEALMSEVCSSTRKADEASCNGSITFHRFQIALNYALIIVNATVGVYLIRCIVRPRYVAAFKTHKKSDLSKSKKHVLPPFGIFVIFGKNIVSNIHHRISLSV